MGKMSLDSEQRKVLATALHEARNFRDPHTGDVGASPRETKALVEALSVETDIRNLNYGDLDSVGALQQRPGQGWKHADNVRLATRDFLKQARANRGLKGSAGTLAQSVQRSKFPDRYDAQGSYAEQLIGSQGAKTSGGASNPTPSIMGGMASRTVKETVNDPDAEKRVALATHLMQTNPHSILLRLGVVSADEPVTKTVTRKVSAMPLRSGQTNNNDNTTTGVIERLVKRADAIDTKQLPYQWGGGHAGKVNAFKATPLDCSGAVSAVLGVNPRVASQFTKWGSPGAGKRVTVYANGKHTFMEIDGHFFGTSHSNPGGGAGWIKRDNISHEYLKNFTARHPSGM